MRRLPLHRFPDNIIRSRTGPGRYNDYGEYVSGTVFRAVLAASVQPVKTEDLQLAEEGTRLSETLKVYVPVRIDRPVRAGDVLTWDGDMLLWNGAPLLWSGATIDGSGDYDPLYAAKDDTVADRVTFAGVAYKVSESQLWPGSHVRAILFRER